MLEELKNRILGRYLEVEGPLDTPCWEYQGCCGSHGYGQITYKNKGLLTHRASWMVHKGGIPEGIFVCHSCDYRKCINPEHLFLGTPNDNIQDMSNKGRDKFDINAKLTAEQVIEIRRLCDKGLSHAYIGPLFDISQATVSRVNTHTSYWWI